MKVSLVATVKDAGEEVGGFLASVAAQTRAPDEVVIVDGGSSDGTLEVLRGAPAIQVISAPGANIARGRNLAIRAAAHDVIAVSDADCVLAPDWLARLLEPLEDGADVAAGFYRSLSPTFFETCAAAVSLPDEDELRPGWMPSARSIALRRETFEDAGGYPEWLEVGEDMYLNHRMVERGARIELAPGAVTYWRIRPTLAATWHQYARYAEGDALAGMYAKRHLLRFGTYAGLALIVASGRRGLLLPAALAGAAYARRPLRRAWRRLPQGSPQRAAGLLAVPALMSFVDAAKMVGYARGLRRRRRGEGLSRP